MDAARAIRLIALRSVLKPDAEARLRHIFRWYSNHFYTPLHVVADLPLEDVLLHYWESVYEGYDEIQREDEVAALLLTPEQRAAQARAKDAAEVDEQEYVAQAEQISALATVAKKPSAPVITDVDEQAEPLEISKTERIPVNITPTDEGLPEINMSFGEEVERFNTMVQPDEV